MDSQTVIAVVEDDPEIGPLVAALLRREGFEAELCPTGEAFDRLRARRRVDLVVLDVMLPGEDGLSICRRLQAEGEVPVLMVTARGDDIDRIVGLEIGADDYLPKPFNPRELVARVRAILRRTRDRHRVAPMPAAEERWRFEGFELDLARRTLIDPASREIELTGGEFDLLAAFVRHPRRVLSRDQLLDWTRGRDAQPFDRAIDVQVGKLRRKLEAHPAGAGLIKTVRGGGYCLAAQVERG
ncbi:MULTISPECIES: response regulator [unclassified Novosphingobium]|uniref:response regulator n=1 Tax=unclassified Novosphingobium TaxID=2644732 RepID=UPI00146EBE03|nr:MULTISPECIES: response regulator [unclassified Novosphingobium]NMN06434.1 two-component system OmpR family response regulator [Novosphingobium sp. SG919]NMN89119.1 two-component system OmpR family response regulator [Novosphingobium sp. SG916]